ncbi:hypothetical protein TAMA11512_13820 [Selenomonas sp. TAMA-11512]|uniref:DUF4153 domain-containing protein n=1 Tax=Selenomonas sp. TAMA-11512 TaxID=3095337 RepID=UPI00308A21C3|nr:hypothetical protein TAMA11512_13820 [Selenomonas sp. TAMA-11512]
MNIAIRILQLKGRAHDLVRRFPVAIFWQTVGFLVGAGIILLRPDVEILSSDAWNREIYEHLLHLAPAVFGAWLSAITCRLLTDIFPVQKSVLLQIALSGLIFIALAYTWHGAEPPNSHLIVGTAGVYLSLGFLALFLLERANQALGLPAFLFAALFSLGTSILLSLGLIVCVAAFWALIITDASLWITETSYLFVALITYNVWGVSAFLSTLPKAGDRYEFSGTGQKLLLYLFFPVYILLLIVLYLYVCKILFSGEMPVGTMNWYASFSLLGFAFFFGTLALQTRLPLFSRFLKWAFILFLPILAVQIYGVYLRYEAYGLTTLRYTSMICTFCGIYTLIMAFFKQKPNQIYLCAAILSLIFSLTPLNVVDVPLHNQEARLHRILTEYNLLKDGHVISRDDIPPDVVAKIIDIAFYMSKESSPLAKEILSESWGVNGFPREKFFHISFESLDAVDITGYSTLMPLQDINSDGFLVIKQRDGSNAYVNLRPYADQLVQYTEEHNTSVLPSKMQSYDHGDFRIHFYSVFFHRTADDMILWENVDGFILIR